MDKKQMCIRIAALDDDVAQLDLIVSTMQALGYGCTPFQTAKQLFATLRNDTFDLLILDWQMPEMNGLDVVMWIREKVSTTLPILFVTLRSDEADICKGLNCGADDFMNKPIRVGELIARVRALLRRLGPREKITTVREIGNVRFDLAAREVTLGGVLLDLRGREYDLAAFMFANVGRLLSRRHLTEAVWGFGAVHTSRTLDTLMSRVRTKLNLRPVNGFRLAAVYNIGYRLDVLSEATHLDEVAAI